MHFTPRDGALDVSSTVHLRPADRCMAVCDSGLLDSQVRLSFILLQLTPFCMLCAAGAGDVPGPHRPVSASGRRLGQRVPTARRHQRLRSPPHSARNSCQIVRGSHQGASQSLQFQGARIWRQSKFLCPHKRESARLNYCPCVCLPDWLRSRIWSAHAAPHWPGQL